VRQITYFYSAAFVVFSAYRSKTDMWDRHYHEFEDWQLDWLLEKPDGKLPLGKIYTSCKKNWL
jgi:hypothetical protein